MWIHRYTLKPKRALGGVARAGVRDGALIRVADGFADIHPWPELGDSPLDEQLATLARGAVTPLTKRSLAFANIDGEARRRGQSLFTSEIPLSHWPGEDPPGAFDTAKVKGTRLLPDGVRLRIDFNMTLTAPEFDRVARDLPRERVDFVEDPCPYDRAAWNRLRESTGLRLALDRGVETDVDVLVVKPAIQDVDAVLASFSREIVITSYMDHAVGQMMAAWFAMTHRQRVSSRCGLFTHVLFEPDPFFERIRADGARLLAPGGTGIGFDDLLDALPWKRLA